MTKVILGSFHGLKTIKKPQHAILMKAPLGRRGRRIPRPERRFQISNRHLGVLWSQAVDAHESDEAEEVDSLLLSSLRYWEVEHDLIEEHLEELGQ